MEILSFIKGLTSFKFSKNEISKSCELILNSLREHTLPAYKAASIDFKAFHLNSSEAKGYAAEFRRTAGGGSDMVSTICGALENACGVLTAIDQKSDTLFNDQEATMALSYQKATYLQIVSAIGFANDFSRKFLNYLYVMETSQADSGLMVGNHLTKAEIAYIEQFFPAFCTCMRFMLMDFKKLEKAVMEMPDVFVNELSEQTLPTTMGSARTDPLGMRNLVLPFAVGVKWNPFYLIGTMIASFQVACFKASTEERDLLQMRRLNLEKIHQKSPDPKLQQQIEYMADRVMRLNYEIQRDREAYGV